jgi:hypothetical protein
LIVKIDEGSPSEKTFKIYRNAADQNNGTPLEYGFSLQEIN